MPAGPLQTFMCQKLKITNPVIQTEAIAKQTSILHSLRGDQGVQAEMAKK